MPEPEEKRIKFCRYCDGVIEWGTEVCPHCGETLKVVEFDDMDFIGTPGAMGAAAPPPKQKPVLENDDEDDIPETVEFEALDMTPADAAPVLKPVTPPPVMEPVKPPPVVKPVKPVRPTKPGRKAPRAPASGKKKKSAPVLKPLSDDPPVVKPLSDDPPVVTPLGPGDVEAPTLPALIDCAVCGATGVVPGGICQTCEAKACVPCMIEANGLRVSSSPDMNRVRWGDRRKKLGPQKVRCPACGKKGVDPA